MNWYPVVSATSTFKFNFIHSECQQYKVEYKLIINRVWNGYRRVIFGIASKVFPIGCIFRKIYCHGWFHRQSKFCYSKIDLVANAQRNFILSFSHPFQSNLLSLCTPITPFHCLRAIWLQKVNVSCLIKSKISIFCFVNKSSIKGGQNSCFLYSFSLCSSAI